MGVVGEDGIKRTKCYEILWESEHYQYCNPKYIWLVGPLAHTPFVLQTVRKMSFFQLVRMCT